jgi:hypothetical protein
VLRWASQQNARHLDEFRYRLIAGREYVSFRMVPRYPIQIGTSDIVVVAHATGTAAHRLLAGLRTMTRRIFRKTAALTARLTTVHPVIPVQTAELYRLPAVPLSSPSRM